MTTAALIRKPKTGSTGLRLARSATVFGGRRAGQPAPVPIVLIETNESGRAHSLRGGVDALRGRWLHLLEHRAAGARCPQTWAHCQRVIVQSTGAVTGVAQVSAAIGSSTCQPGDQTTATSVVQYQPVFLRPPVRRSGPRPCAVRRARRPSVKHARQRCLEIPVQAPQLRDAEERPGFQAAGPGPPPVVASACRRTPSSGGRRYHA